VIGELVHGSVPLPIAIVFSAGGVIVLVGLGAWLSELFRCPAPFRCRWCGCAMDCDAGCWRYERDLCSRCVRDAADTADGLPRLDDVA
jgi:hypothetical protein